RRLLPAPIEVRALQRGSVAAAARLLRFDPGSRIAAPAAARRAARYSDRCDASGQLPTPQTARGQAAATSRGRGRRRGVDGDRRRAAAVLRDGRAQSDWYPAECCEARG